MFKNFFFTIFLSLIFVSFLEASNEKINQQLFELKTSQDYAQKINDEKIALIMGQIIQKENEIKVLEQKLDKLENQTLVLKGEQNKLLSKKETKAWSPSDWGTIAIAILTLFLVLLTGCSVYLIRRQNKEQEINNKKSLSTIQNNVNLNQLENQIFNIVGFMKKEFIEKKSFHRDLINRLLSKMKWTPTQIRVKETDEEIFIQNSYLSPEENELTIKKDTLFRFLIKSKTLIGTDELKSLIKNNSNVEAEIETFVSQLSHLIILIEEALELGLNRKSAKYLLSLFFYHSKFCYQIGYLDDSSYLRLKTYLIHSIYGSKKLNVSEDLTDEYLDEINDKNKSLGLNINESDIKDITYNSEKIENDILIEVRMILKNKEFDLSRSEDGKWKKVEATK